MYKPNTYRIEYRGRGGDVVVEPPRTDFFDAAQRFKNIMNNLHPAYARLYMDVPDTNGLTVDICLFKRPERPQKKVQGE